MQKKEKIAYTPFGKFISRKIIAPYAVRLLNVEYVDHDGVFDLSPPFAVCGNHVGFWDPWVINYPFSDYIQYVVADFSFRNPFRRWYLRQVGSIPKTKSMIDIKTIKHILSLVKQGGILGLFPEGHRNWDGVTLPIVPNTAKLLKRLKIPVVMPLMKGMFLSSPRWGASIRRGKVLIEYYLLFKPEELESMSEEQINQRMTERLKVNEYEFQREQMIEYHGKNLAMHIEQTLFYCPQCNSIGTLLSEDDKLVCQNCGYKLRYNIYGFFEKLNGDKLVFDNMHDWHLWQQKSLAEFIQNAFRSESYAPILKDTNVIISQGYKTQRLKRLMTGTLYLYRDRLQCDSIKGETLIWEIDKIQGINVQHHEIFEFYYQNKLYSFKFPKTVSSIKWQYGLELVSQYL